MKKNLGAIERDELMLKRKRIKKQIPSLQAFCDTQYECKRCGGRLFRVFGGDYLTVISCADCKVPISVHEG